LCLAKKARSLFGILLLTFLLRELNKEIWLRITAFHG
jgi:hypothetical protein